MDLRRIRLRFHQWGGFRLVKEYTRLGVLPAVGFEFIRILLSGKSPKQLNALISQKMEPILQEKYQALLQERKAYYDGQKLEHRRSKVIWFCWLQGLEQVPPIVMACYRSLRQHLSDREIRVVTEENWSGFVELPEHIVLRWEKKQMPPALFTDLLRLQLLIRYGGTWIDSTVLCTGTAHAKELLDADLFLFQYRPPESSPATFEGISNWFITSCTNNPVLLVLRDLLYAYWRDYDCTLYYFIFHLFFSMLAKEYPEAIAEMPYGYSVWSHTLQRHWEEPFSQNKWDKLTSIVDFHKLTYRAGLSVVENSGNYYNWILKEYNHLRQ